MKNLTYVILCCLLELVLFASMIQKATHFLKFEKLNGVEVTMSMPSLTFTNYIDGSFQSGTEAYLKQNFGFREPLLRCYNQYLWDFFGKSYVSRGSLSFGKDGWLYEPWAVNDYYGIHFYKHAQDADQMRQILSEEAKRVYQLQHILDSYGIKLFVSLVPSKDMICPEYLPENRNNRYEGDEKMSARDFYREEYPQMGINLLDLEQYFLRIKDTADFMVFPKTGTHWSRYAALFAADTLINYMEHLGEVNMHNLVFRPRTLEESHPADMDLEQLLNLIRPLPKPKYYYAKVTADEDTTAIKPRMITVGDSFWWNVIIQIPTPQIFFTCPYWYYNSSIYYDPYYHSVKEVDIVEEILSSDFVNLFYSTTQLYKCNNDFTKKAVLAFCYDPEEIDSITNNIAMIIHDDSSWMARLNERATIDGKPIEEVVLDDAKWIIANQPEKYLPALNDSIPTKRSKRVDAYFTIDTAAFIEREVERTKKSIMDSEEKMNAIREKSVQQGKSFEQAVNDDAHWIVNRKLEKGTLVISRRARKSVL